MFVKMHTWDYVRVVLKVYHGMFQQIYCVQRLDDFGSQQDNPCPSPSLRLYGQPAVLTSTQLPDSLRRSRLIEEWEHFQQAFIDEGVRQWRSRFVCVDRVSTTSLPVVDT